GCAWKGGDHVAAGLRLPPGVDHRTALVADHPVVPLPGLGVDGLAHGAEDTQALARGLLHRVFAFAHQGADGSRGGVEDVDLVLVAHLPETRRVGIGGYPLEHQADGTVGEGAVDDVGVARYPAHVCGTPVDLTLLVVEHVFV